MCMHGCVGSVVWGQHYKIMAIHGPPGPLKQLWSPLAKPIKTTYEIRGMEIKELFRIDYC